MLLCASTFFVLAPGVALTEPCFEFGIDVQQRDVDLCRLLRKQLQPTGCNLVNTAARRRRFITASGFTQEARQYVRNIEKRIVLIDGPQLAQLMYEHGIGASTVVTYEVKKIDSDYFVDE